MLLHCVTLHQEFLAFIPQVGFWWQGTTSRFHVQDVGVSAYFWEEIFKEVSNPKKGLRNCCMILEQSILGLFFPYPFPPIPKKELDAPYLLEPLMKRK